jgi:hypothetical protein
MNMKAKWLSEIYAAMSEGKLLEYHINGIWIEDDTAGPDLNSNPDYWRIKPEPREHLSRVQNLSGIPGHFINVPITWPLGMPVFIKEIF